MNLPQQDHRCIGKHILFAAEWLVLFFRSNMCTALLDTLFSFFLQLTQSSISAVALLTEGFLDEYHPW
jgi:hypothetical protein